MAVVAPSSEGWLLEPHVELSQKTIRASQTAALAAAWGEWLLEGRAALSRLAHRVQEPMITIT
jgi:hypothetical protein